MWLIAIERYKPSLEKIEKRSSVVWLYDHWQGDNSLTTAWYMHFTLVCPCIAVVSRHWGVNCVEGMPVRW